jgi:TP901 family phage tail tape measure protein
MYLAAGLGAAAYAAADFQHGMRNVQTLVDTSKYSMRDLSNGVLDLSDRMGIGATEISGAMYQMISATGDVGNSLYVLEQAAMASKVGVGSITEAIDLGTGVLKAYSMDMKNFGMVMDLATRTVKIGKTTLGEMGQDMGKVVPLAAALKVPLEDLFGAVATLTKGGMQNDIAITALKGTLAAAVKPTSEAAETAKRLGINFDAAAVQAMGFAKWMAHVQEQTKGNVTDLGMLFGDIRGLVGVLSLGGARMQEFATITRDVRDSMGSMQKKFDEISKEDVSQFLKSINQLKNTMIRIGNDVIPVVNRIVNSVRDWYRENPMLAKTVAYVTAGLVAMHMSGIVPLTAGIAGLVTKLPALIAGLKAASIANTGMLAGMINAAGAAGILAAKIAAILAAGYGLYRIVTYLNEITGLANGIGRSMHWWGKQAGIFDKEDAQADVGNRMRAGWQKQAQSGAISQEEYDRRVGGMDKVETLLREIRDGINRPKPAIAG